MYGVPAYLCGGGLHRCCDFDQSFQYGRNGEDCSSVGGRHGKRGDDFPAPPGVTEAGDGEDGRIKSALGIGALLSDGLGDTIRVL